MLGGTSECCRRQMFHGSGKLLQNFIPEFAKLAAPLHQLPCKGQPFVWHETCRSYLEELKGALCSAPLWCPVSGFPDWEKLSITIQIGVRRPLGQSCSRTTRPA